MAGIFTTETSFKGLYIEGSQYNGKNNKLFLLLFTGNWFIEVFGDGQDILYKCQ